MTTTPARDYATGASSVCINLGVHERPFQGLAGGRVSLGTIQVRQGGAMATYEYKCTKCDTRFEVTCHMDEQKAKAVCPKCGSKKVKQVFTAAFTSPPPDKY